MAAHSLPLSLSAITMGSIITMLQLCPPSSSPLAHLSRWYLLLSHPSCSCEWQPRALVR